MQNIKDEETLLLCLIDLMFQSFLFLKGHLLCSIDIDSILYLSFRLSLKKYGKEKLLAVKSQATPLEERMEGQMMIFQVTYMHGFFSFCKIIDFLFLLSFSSLAYFRSWYYK